MKILRKRVPYDLRVFVPGIEGGALQGGKTSACLGGGDRNGTEKNPVRDPARVSSEGKRPLNQLTKNVHWSGKSRRYLGGQIVRPGGGGRGGGSLKKGGTIWVGYMEKVNRKGEI